jgi:hypothetical protein
LQARLERAEKKANKKRIAELSAELAMPPFPKALAYLWRAYLRLRRRQGAGFSGPQPVGWQDIDAFLRRSGLRMAPWEIELIEALDDIYLKPEPTPATPEGQAVVAAVSAADGAGVRALLRGIAKRKKGG